MVDLCIKRGLLVVTWLAEVRHWPGPIIFLIGLAGFAILLALAGFGVAFWRVGSQQMPDSHGSSAISTAPATEASFERICERLEAELRDLERQARRADRQHEQERLDILLRHIVLLKLALNGGCAARGISPTFQLTTEELARL